MSDISIRLGYVDVIDHTGERVKEAALGLKRATLDKSPLFAIPLSNAWLYNEPEYMAHATINIATFLGMFPDTFLCKRIANLILDYLPDLINSKPYDVPIGKECGEGKLVINGEIQHFGMTNTGKFIH
jgi:hypothetical protein